MNTKRKSILKHFTGNKYNELDEIFRQGRLEKIKQQNEQIEKAEKEFFQQHVNKDSQEKPIQMKKDLKIPTPKEFIKLEKDVRDAFRQGRLQKIEKEVEKVNNLKPLINAVENVEIAVREQNKNPPEIYEQPEILALPSTSSTTQQLITVGPILAGYLTDLNDPTFGIYKHKDTKKLMIGAEILKFLGDEDFSVKGTKYTATPGLMVLLNQSKIRSDEYTQEDLKNYTKIVIDSNTIYKDYNPKNGPKSNGGDKWKKIIKPIYDSEKQKNKQGGGLVDYIEDPKEYIQDIDKTTKRLQYIASEERAGNTNFHKEKILILNEISDRLRHYIDAPQGDTEANALTTEFFASLLQWLRQYVGSGFVNNILNTKQHMPERHIADKILQEKAWEIAKNPETPILSNKFAAASFTTGAMQMKRFYGWDLK